MLLFQIIIINKSLNGFPWRVRKKMYEQTVEAVQNWIFLTGCIKKATRYGWLT